MANFDFGRSFKATTNPNPIKSVKMVNADFRKTWMPKPPGVPDAPDSPTVDQALIDREAGDTIRRRRSRSNNVFAGDTSVPTSSLAVQSLLGG